MDAQAAADVEILSPHDPDPFALHDGQALPDDALDGPDAVRSITVIADEAGASCPGPHGGSLHICRGPAGHYHLVDLGIGSDPARAVGAPVTFSIASDIAARILAGDTHALTKPAVTKLLALAYLAALAEAQRRKSGLRGRAEGARFQRDAQSRAQEVDGVSSSDAAAPATPLSPPEKAGAAAAPSHESRGRAA